MVSILNTVRFVLLTFLAEKRWILGKKTLRLALRDRERDKNCFGKRLGTVRYGTVLWIKSDSLLYKNASRYGSRFSNKFHQIKLFNIEITKNGSGFGTVRFALLQKISALNGKI